MFGYKNSNQALNRTVKNDVNYVRAKSYNYDHKPFLLKKVGFPVDFTINSELTYILDGQNDKLLVYDESFNYKKTYEELNDLIKTYGGTPQSLKINNKFIIIQVRRGILIYNRETKSHHYKKIKGEFLFDLRDENLYIVDDKQSEIIEYKIFNNELKLYKRHKLKLDYFTRFFVRNKNMFVVDFIKDNFIKKSLNYNKTKNILNLQNLYDEKYIFYLEEVNSNIALFLAYNENETVIMSYNLDQKKLAEINLSKDPNLIINKHDKYKNDFCNFNKKICTRVILKNKNKLVMLYSYKNSTYISEIEMP